MRWSLVRALLVCVLLSAGVPGRARGQPAAADVQLSPGDAVRVEVKDEPGLSGEFPVGEDGAVLLPLIGLVAAAKRPFSEVRREVEERYAGELSEPVVRVTPLVRIAVLGEVRRPGLFPVDPTYTLGDVLALAGGLTPSADTRRVFVQRGDQAIVVRLDPESSLLDLEPRSGDQIIVARQSWFREHLAVFVGAMASVAAAGVTALIVR